VTLRPVFHSAARLEFDETATWYDNQRPGLGSAFVMAVDDAISAASETPQRFPTILRDIRRARVRRFPYSVFFRVKADQLIVIAIFHARRDPTIWRRRT
jgi:plasmid stabilization system protein ParE